MGRRGPIKSAQRPLGRDIRHRIRNAFEIGPEYVRIEWSEFSQLEAETGGPEAAIDFIYKLVNEHDIPAVYKYLQLQGGTGGMYGGAAPKSWSLDQQVEFTKRTQKEMGIDSTMIMSDEVDDITAISLDDEEDDIEQKDLR